MLVSDLTARLTAFRYNWRHERDLQDGIATVLSDAALTFEREATLQRGCRIDFLLAGHVLAGLGIEVKVKGGPEEVLRQLQRYARSDRVDQIVLATTKHTHRGLPAEIAGKPLTVAYLTHLA